MNIELNKETLAVIYSNSNAVGRKAIREQLGEEFTRVLPVIDRVKTLNDAIEELGEDHEAVSAYRAIEWRLGVGLEDIKAYLQLRIITAALNEGWEPQFIEGEQRWYGWYNLISKEDLDEMSEEEKKERRVVGRASNNACAFGGLVYAVAHVVSSLSHSNYGSRLAFKSEELAEYAAKQFAEIYADYCFIPKKKEA